VDVWSAPKLLPSLRRTPEPSDFHRTPEKIFTEVCKIISSKIKISEMSDLKKISIH
jgi:hypothetical protein